MTEIGGVWPPANPVNLGSPISNPPTPFSRSARRIAGQLGRAAGRGGGGRGGEGAVEDGAALGGVGALLVGLIGDQLLKLGDHAVGRVFGDEPLLGRESEGIV